MAWVTEINHVPDCLVAIWEGANFCLQKSRMPTGRIGIFMRAFVLSFENSTTLFVFKIVGAVKLHL